MNEQTRATGPGSSERELVTSRVIRASPERLFQALADPGQLARWWGPKGFTNTFQEFDFRPGGRWRFVMHGPDGKDYANESVLVEIAAPERVVLRHVSAPRFDLTLTFAREGDRTAVGWRQAFETAEECRRIAKYAVQANEQNLDRLTAVVLENP